MKIKQFMVWLFLFFAIGTVSSRLSAQGFSEATQLTYITFSQPVEVPGTTLPAGTYTFKVADSWAGGIEVVQISNREQNHMFASILAIPNHRMTPTGKTVVMFKEQVSGSPAAVKTWFYPGQNFGNEFVYPRSAAMKLAAANHENVPAIPDSATTQGDLNNYDALKNAHVTMATPAQTETEIAANQNDGVSTASPKNTNEQATSQIPPENTQVAQTLPKTASAIPLVALIGMLLLACAGVLGLVRRHLSR